MRSAEDIVGAVGRLGARLHRLRGPARRRSRLRRSRSIRASSTTLAQSDAVLAAGEVLAAGRPEKVILRVDRTDPSKNVVRGFRAFELYLDAHPEMHTRVKLLALLDPSRQEIPEYAEYVGAIQREARRVNYRFQQDGWTPIDLQISDNFPQAVAAYKDFDVLLVNAIFDGLNLVAKEAPLVNERDGVLILSENAGAHEEVGDWALTVNPFDVAGQADAIHRALEMSADEATRANRGDSVVGARPRPRRMDRRAAEGARRRATRVRRVNTLVAEGQLRPINPATLAPVGAVPVTRDVASIIADCARGTGGVGRSSFERAAGVAASRLARGARAEGRDRLDDHRRDGKATRRGVHDGAPTRHRAARVARAQRRARAGSGAGAPRHSVSRAQARARRVRAARRRRCDLAVELSFRRFR